MSWRLCVGIQLTKDDLGKTVAAMTGGRPIDGHETMLFTSDRHVRADLSVEIPYAECYMGKLVKLNPKTFRLESAHFYRDSAFLLVTDLSSTVIGEVVRNFGFRTFAPGPRLRYLVRSLSSRGRNVATQDNFACVQKQLDLRPGVAKR